MKRHASMNRIYRLVWSRVRNAWVAVAETARGRGKGSSRKLVAAALSLSAALAQAAPSGGQVAAGTGSISHSGATTTIRQASQNLSLNWASFNIAPQETVNFLQPSAAAIAVNRIADTNGTHILGHLNANGQVWLVNPNGILFGQGAQVNVGALVASTLDLNDAGLSGNTRAFSGNGTGGIVNRGTINAADGGYVALLGNTVSNQGTISARLGAVALGAGSAATLTFSGNSLVKMQVDQSVLASLAENGGLINADGGMVLMNAGAKNALLASVVNNTGVIEARTVENHEGTIILLGGMTAGTVNVGGTLDASAPNGGNGGTVQLLGNRVGLFAANVNASGDSGGGTVLVGGDYQGKNPDIQNASATYMSADSTIAADAITNGNGGKVILWSDDSTRFYGGISAKGGAQSGNGGFVETSGHYLDVAGATVNASAANGNTGTWLLDPFDVSVSGAVSSGGLFSGGLDIWTPSTPTSNVLVGDIATNLLTTDVTITTTGPFPAAGNITWAAGTTLDYDDIGTKTLTLQAANNIVFNGGSITDLNTATADKLHVVLNADADASGAGNIQMNGASIMSNGGDITLGGGANPLTTAAVGSDPNEFGTALHGVYLNNTILNASAGNISIRGTGIAGTSHAYGIAAESPTVIQTTSGNITLNGTGGAGIDGNTGVLVAGTGTNITSETGEISITGQGAGAGGYNIGLEIRFDAAVTSTGAATITLNGTGGAGTNVNMGVHLNGNARVTSSDGDISITGQGAGIGAQSYGILIGLGEDPTGPAVTSTGAAKITLNGTGGAGTDENHGVYISDAGTNITSANGAISITGLGAGTGLTNYGLFMDAGATVASTDAATITMIGTGGTGTDGNLGVYLSGMGTSVTSATGAIDITGKGAGTGAGSMNYGIFMRDGATIFSADTATITLDGTGGAGQDDNYGVFLRDADTSLTSSTGDISITGLGAGTGGANHGIRMGESSAVTSTGVARITLDGTGGAGTDNNMGVYLSDPGTSITSSDGNISITGLGAGATEFNSGIKILNEAAVSSTGAATITLDGTGGAGTDENIGVIIAANITSATGDISITGQGAGTGERNHGIRMAPDENGSASEVSSSGTATITLSGTGSSAGTNDNHGFYFSGIDSIISSVDGAVSITGQGAGTGVMNYGISMDEGAVVSATGAANIILDGRGAVDAEGIYTTTSGDTNFIGDAASTGNITLIAHTATGADSIFLSDLEISGSGNLVLQPLQPATTIGLAGGAGTFNLDASTELPTIQPGFASITIGRDNGTGLIAFGDGAGAETGFTFNANTTLRNPGASSNGITITDPLSVGVKNLTLNTTGTSTQTAAITAAGLELLGVGGNHTLTNTDSGSGPGNAIATLAGNTGAVNYQQTGSLAIASVGATTGLTTANSVLVRTTGASADLTLSNGVTANGAGDALVLATGRNFINSVGASAVDASNGRWLVYSTSPAGSTENGLTALAGSTSPRLYNRTFASNAPASIAAGNHLIYSTQPTLTVTADDKTRAYGDANPSFTATTGGAFVSDDGVTDTLATAGLTGTAALSSLATATSPVSSSPFTISAAAGDLASSAGYGFGFVDGTLSINKAHLTVTADDKTRLYGAANPTLTSIVSGFVNGENAGTAAGFTGAANATTLANATTPVGTAPITAGAGNLAATNYDFTYLVDGTLTIDKAHLTVTADDKTRLYGAANPALTSTVSGFVNGENAGTATGFTGAANPTTAAVATTPVGTAPITAGAGNLAAANYDFTTLVNGTLIISKAELTVTADDHTRLYGAANPILTSTVSGFVNGENAGTAAGFTGTSNDTTAADATTNVGTAPITAGAGTLAATNYAFTRLVDGTLTINAAPPTINAAPTTPQRDSQPKPVEAAPAQLQSGILAPQASTRPEEISLSPTLTVTQRSSSDAVPGGDASSSGAGDESPVEPRWRVAIAGGDASSSGSGNGTVVNTMMTIGGGMGPSLQVLNGGMKLPDNIAKTDKEKTP